MLSRFSISGTPISVLVSPPLTSILKGFICLEMPPVRSLSYYFYSTRKDSPTSSASSHCKMSYYPFQPGSSLQDGYPPASDKKASAPSVVPTVRSLFSNSGQPRVLETTNDAWQPQPDTPGKSPSISHSPLHPTVCPEAACPRGSVHQPRYNCSPDEKPSAPPDGTIHLPSTGPQRPRAAQVCLTAPVSLRPQLTYVQACENCRAAKVRCCGKRPCERCQKDRLKCRYKARS